MKVVLQCQNQEALGSALWGLQLLRTWRGPNPPKTAHRVFRQETQSRMVRHIQLEMAQWTLARSTKALASKAKAKESKDSKDSETRTRTGTRTRTQLNVEIVESAVTSRRIVEARRTRPTKVVRHNLDSVKLAKNEVPVAEGVFDVSCFNVDAVEVRESEWIS